MKCANGEFVKECHAAVVDFSRLGLGSAEEVELLNDFGSQRLLARGELVERVFGSGPPVPTLVVDDAWRGATGTQGDWGSYWATIPSGITCFTFPCPTLYRFKINAPRVGWLHSIDLNHAGATQSQIDDALTDLYQGPGLIGFGKMKTIVGPAGKGREFRPSEFYTKVDERASIQCGGFTYPPNPACGFGEFCESPEGTCFIADLPGTCQSVPTLCPLAIIPVCGCDGNTYGNDCERQQAQVALDHEGGCSIGTNSCGFVTCGPGTTCCHPLYGICTPPGTVCIQSRPPRNSRLTLESISL
jgi:hypothetical protein